MVTVSANILHGRKRCSPLSWLSLAPATTTPTSLAFVCWKRTASQNCHEKKAVPGWRKNSCGPAAKATSLTRQAQGEPEDSDDLMTDTIPAPRPIVEGLLHEGMLLFGGKSKRGKSWLMLDLALSVATGNPVWRHFEVREPQPVLYIALEDSRARIQRRLQEIRPGRQNQRQAAASLQLSPA